MNEADRATFYSGDATGYTDYPTLKIGGAGGPNPPGRQREGTSP